jgi:uncharacterized NAD(P)/FAD-binding protein YdhS
LSEREPVIVVIGGGFSGAAVAAQLLRRGRPVRVVLVNRFGPIGRGVAYRTRIEAHVLNVPAGGMSALPDDPEHFLRWASSRDPSIRGDTFVSRRVYGEYLEALLREAESAANGTARLERVVGEVRDVEPKGSRFEVVFSDGGRREAERIVLALGNYSPNDPPADGAEFYATERYVRDPWIRGALDVIREGEAVLLLGTGLTMLDIALDLASRGTSLPIRAVSRHGLLPQRHASVGPAPPAPPPGPSRSLRELTRWVRRTARETGDWRAAVGALRGATPAIWQGFTPAERARFLRHLRPWWDVHRHRAAPPTADAVAAMIEHGELRPPRGARRPIRAGRCRRARARAAARERPNRDLLRRAGRQLHRPFERRSPRRRPAARRASVARAHDAGSESSRRRGDGGVRAGRRERRAVAKPLPRRSPAEGAILGGDGRARAAPAREGGRAEAAGLTPDLQAAGSRRVSDPTASSPAAARARASSSLA